MKNKYSVRTFDIAGPHSWAVFNQKDIKGIRGVVPHGQALPICSGLSKREAGYHKKVLESTYGGIQWT